MQNAIKPSLENKSKIDSLATPEATIPPSKAEADVLSGKAEAQAWLEKVRSVIEDGAKIGSIALGFLAEEVGKTTSKAGRPAPIEFHAFVLAMERRGATYGQRAELCRKMNRNVPAGHKVVAPEKAKATAANGSASYKVNSPASVSINLGEQ